MQGARSGAGRGSGSASPSSSSDDDMPSLAFVGQLAAAAPAAAPAAVTAPAAAAAPVPAALPPISTAAGLTASLAAVAAAESSGRLSAADSAHRQAVLTRLHAQQQTLMAVLEGRVDVEPLSEETAQANLAAALAQTEAAAAAASASDNPALQEMGRRAARVADMFAALQRAEEAEGSSDEDDEHAPGNAITLLYILV
jgi:hypothetical protein